MKVIDDYYPDWKDLKIHESSPANRGASVKLSNQCKNYTASHYFPDLPFGQMTENGFQNENLENQTFENESFDLVVTQDVFEHLFNIEAAFSEIARTLKKGGAHIFTTPLVNFTKPTEVWAKKSDKGKVIYLKEPEYHGNPIDSKGSLVTYHFGYDICNLIFKSSGLYTTIVKIENLDLGIKAEYIEVLISKKY
jgi:SAM-dependent methyltransferase